MKYTSSIKRLTEEGAYDETYEILLVSEPNRIQRFFGKEPEMRTFVGSSTVWHETTGGIFKRASGFEYVLAEIYSELKHKEIMSRL